MATSEINLLIANEDEEMASSFPYSGNTLDALNTINAFVYFCLFCLAHSDTDTLPTMGHCTDKLYRLNEDLLTAASMVHQASTISACLVYSVAYTAAVLDIT